MFRKHSRLTGIVLLASTVPCCSFVLAEPRVQSAGEAGAPAVPRSNSGNSADGRLTVDPSATSSGVHTAGSEQDKRRLAAVFRAQGYFGAEITEGPPLREARFWSLPGSAPQPIGWQTVAGPLYKIGLVELRGISGLDAGPKVRNDFADMLVRYPGLPARALTLDAMEDEIRWRLLRASYPLASVTARSVVPDVISRTVTVRMDVDAGVQARFGEVSFKGLRRIGKERLMEGATFTAGDLFDPVKLQGFRLNIERMSLFQDVRIGHAEKTDASGRLPVEVRVREFDIAKEVLEKSSLKGMIATLSVLGLLAANQVAAAGGAPLRFTRPVALICLILLIVCGLFAIERVESLLAAL